MKKNVFLIILLVASVSQQAFPSVSSRINTVLQRKSLRNVEFGVKVVDASSGKVVYKRNPDKPMIPASNMKIITTAAAVEVLGKDYKFVTRAGIFEGKLAVIGSGDPLFGDKGSGRETMAFIDTIIEELKAKKIESIEGIIIDSTFFDDVRAHPSWSPAALNRSYACEVSGLNFNANCISLNVRNAGSYAHITVNPPTDYVTLVNQVKLTSSGHSAIGAYRTSVPNKLVVKGNCRTAAGFDVAIERPALFFGTVLSEKLESSGIRVKGEVEEKYIKDKPDIELLCENATPLSDVLERCNKDSFNLAAESLIKTISAEMTTGKIYGEWEHGLRICSRYLEKIGVDREEFVLDDGCGLSRENRLSPNTITTVLQRIYSTPLKDFYIDSLSIGGVDGTTSKYFTDPRHTGKVFGKTGYISGVRTFSGFVKTPKGDYIFSILSAGGGSYVRGAINDIARAIIDGTS